MKQNRIIKISLILILFLIVGLIKTMPCFGAVNWNENDIGNMMDNLRGNGVFINRTNLRTSNYIFCREHNATLTDGSVYTLDTTKTNPTNYPIITYYKGENQTGDTTTNKSEAKSVKVQGADIAYIFAKFDKDKPKDGEYSKYQKAYWALLGQYSEAKLDEKSKDLYWKAQEYQKYIAEVEQFKINNHQTDKDGYDIVLNTDRTTTEYVNNNIVVVGPFTANYPGSWDKEHGIAFGTIKFKFTKADGTNLKIYDLKKENGDNWTNQDLKKEFRSKCNRRY